MSDEQLAKTIPSFHELFERSKNDRAMIVGSEAREVIARVRELEQALRITMEQAVMAGMEDTPLYGIPEAALQVTDKAAKK